MPHSSLIFRTWFENEADRWKAVWIGNGGDKPIYLRKSLQQISTKQVERVIVFASGLGHFNLTDDIFLALPRRCHVVTDKLHTDRKSTRLNSSHRSLSRMPSSA